MLAGVLAVGCGDDDGGDDPVDLGEDGGGMIDAGSDAAAMDAARDTGSAPPDGGPAVVCSFTRSEIATVANGTVSVDDPIALSVRNEGASLSWIDYQLGARHLSTSWFGSDRSALFTPLGDGGAAVQAEPGNVATASGFLTVWSDDTDGLDVRVQGWGADGRPTAPGGTKITTNGNVTDESAPVLARGADGNVLLVWQNAGVASGSALLLDGSGAAIGTPRNLDNYGPQIAHPVLAAVGNRYMLAWGDPVGLRVHMLLLDAAGAPIGSDVLVDVEGNAAGTVDIAASPEGGALVFDVLVAGQRPEVRFRTFDATGVLTRQEVVLTNYPTTGSMPSIVPIAGGYVVAYRSPKMPDMQLQLALVDNLGVVTSGISVAPIVDRWMPVQLRIAPDGTQMFLAWVDPTAGTAAYNLKRTWVTCD